MNENDEGFRRRARENLRGQVLIYAAVSMTMLLGLTALVIGAGRLYGYHNTINASTQAGASAGASAMFHPGATAST